MNNFKNLEIWNLGFDLGKSVYLVTKSFPKDELYGLTSQLRRASVSIASNIAEGCGRSTSKDFRSFLYISLGSLRELETQILFAKDFGYISEVDFEIIYKKINKLSGKLTNFIKSVSSRC